MIRRKTGGVSVVIVVVTTFMIQSHCSMNVLWFFMNFTQKVEYP